MNLCIDQGNSSTKVGLFNQERFIGNLNYDEFGIKELSELFSKFTFQSCIFSSVACENQELATILQDKFKNYIELTHETAVPIENNYSTPETLGKDRLAGVVGASYLKPGEDILVIDAGTAITYDFINASGQYLGGNIAPGLNMRLRSLHEFTYKLPEVEPKLDSPLLGKSTESAILSGALYGIVFEIDGYIDALKIKYPQLSTFLTGGSTFYFDNKLKNAIFAERNLVLIGLNRILLYNVQK
jgi:type III pantothenate kinase